MKIILLLLILMGVKVKAETFYLEEMPINNLNLRIEETKKYRWYQNERLESFFLEGTNTDFFSLKDEKKYYYTAYSAWTTEQPKKENYREIIERDVFIYQTLKKIRHFYLEIDSDSEELIEFSIYSDDAKINKTSFCQGCSSDYYMHIADNNYEVATKVQKLFLTLDDYIEPNNLKIKVLFKNKNIKYKITIYEDENTSSNIYYQKEFNSSENLEEIFINAFDIKESAYADEIIKYEENDTLILKNKFKEYSYRDKYVLYYNYIKKYYPTYEENVEDYIKDENDFILEKAYFYKEPVIVKDKIIITSKEYDLNDYIKTNLKYEIASNIDISKNGKYLVKYIFDHKTIETEVEVKTNNEYIEDLEQKLVNKNKEITDIISLKNEIIDRLESNLKSKDEIISKKEIKTMVKKTNIIPTILITIGVMIFIFCIYKSFNKLSK